jgi:DNA invertase Pin-like site-specific DNA recombinase
MPEKLSQDIRNNVKSFIAQGEPTKNIVQATGVSRSTVKRMKSEINPDYIRPKGGRPYILKQTTKYIIRFKLR